MLQEIMAGLLGLAAVVYVIWKFFRQFSHFEQKPECENCPLPDLKKGKKV